jgi:hypothetical protein
MDIMSLAYVAALGFIVAMTGLAAISGLVVIESVNEGDAGSAWVWAVLFVMLSTIDALCFWWLV